MIQVIPFWARVNVLCLILLSCAVGFCTAGLCEQRGCNVLLFVCDIPDICIERLQRKDKSEKGMLQIDQAGGQNEEAHSELEE